MTHDVESARLPNGLRLPYVKQGEESGGPVVLLHAPADWWRSFERSLWDQSERVAADVVALGNE